MALKNTAVFAQTPKTASVVVTAAVPLTGSGGLDTNTPSETVQLLAAGPDGALVTRVSLVPRGTVTAHCAYLFVRRANQLVDERSLRAAVSVPAKTASTTTPPSVMQLEGDVSEQTPLRLGAGDELHVAISAAQAVGVVFSAEYTDF